MKKATLIPVLILFTALGLSACVVEYGTGLAEEPAAPVQEESAAAEETRPEEAEPAPPPEAGPEEEEPWEPGPLEGPAGEEDPRLAGLYGQADPTLQEHPRITWEHLEFLVFGPEEDYTETRFPLSDMNVSPSQPEGEDAAILIRLPACLEWEHTILNYHQDFARGGVKMGEVVSFSLEGDPSYLDSYLSPDETAVYGGFGEAYPLVETGENVEGGFLRTDRYIRTIVPSFYDNHTVRYLVSVSADRIVSIYFYVSTQATAEDLEIYDRIAETILLV